MSQNTPTRFTKGSTNHAPRSLLSQLPVQDVSAGTFYLVDDFYSYDTNTWAISGTGTPAAAVNTSAPFVNGQIAISSTSALGDSSILQTHSNGWIANPSNNTPQLWFRATFQVDDATNSNVVLGLVGNTNPFAGSAAGIYVQKAPAGTSLSAVVSDGTTATTVTFKNTAGGTYALAANTVYDVIGYFDGGLSGTVKFALSTVTNGAASQPPAANATVVTTHLPASTLGLYATMAVKAGTAAARTLTVDRFIACGERN